MYLKDLELIIPKSAEECLNTIKLAFPSYYELSKTFMTSKYSSKIENNNISIISRGIGYPEIVFKVQLVNNNEDTTKLTAIFSKTIIQRVFIWICTLLMFFGSILYILGIIIGDIPFQETPILTCGLPLLVLLMSISYLLYTEIIRKREKKRMVVLLNNVLSSDISGIGGDGSN